VLVILSGLLIGGFGFPPDLVLHRIVPGTALGVLVGDLVYTWLAIRLSRAAGRSDVTAMPFGIDTPTLFAMVFGVLGPVKVATGDPVLAWKVGMAVTIAIGVTKIVVAPAGDLARRLVPRAALLGSIGGIAILLIAFVPSLKLMADPLVGLVGLGILLLGFFGGVRFPLGVPAAFAALLAGTVIYWGRLATVGGAPPPYMTAAAAWHAAVPWPTLAWLDAWTTAAPYLAIAMPFALITIIGGIDNTESAVAAGDEYRARDILMTEAVATVIAGFCGGVVQNTPYIGHPAYKAMGARAGYTLATGLVVGGGAIFGVLSVLVGVLPEAAMAPILVFIGLEITAQAFLASPARHGPAVALAFVPTIAAVVLIEAGTLLSAAGTSVAAVKGDAHATLRVLGNGFVITAVLWAWALAAIIDRRFAIAAAVLATASLASLFGVIHSPLASGGLFWPWAVDSGIPRQVAAAYGVLAGLTALAAAPGYRDATS
jgi:AGZA family xanthine/uracil permease-like MFS transporter